MSVEKLRIGLLLDSYTVADWVAENVRYFLDHPLLELTLVVLNEGQPPRVEFSSFFDRLRNNRAFFYRFDAADSRRATAHGYAEDEVDIAELLRDVPSIGVIPKMTKFSDRFPKDVVAEIKSHKLDFVYRFGFRIIRGAILDCSRYGVFSFHHDDNDEYRGGPPGFWEVYEGNPVSGVTLQILTDKLDGGKVFAKTYCRTHPTSPRINQRQLFRVGNILVHQLCDYLLNERPTTEQLAQRCSSGKPYDKRIYVKPTNFETLNLLSKIAIRSVRSKIALGKNVPRWSVGVATVPDDSARPLEKIAGAKPSWFEPDDSRFVADPFAVARDGQLYLFVEELEFADWHGRISVMKFDSRTGFTQPTTVLKTEHHLSFPFLFEDHGELYMIPEQAAASKIIMYRCAEFPDKWVEVRTLLDDFRGIDTVLHFDGEVWWLFTTNGHNDNFNSNLYLFYSDSLTGEFRPHRQNPIRSSLDGSRMAGPIIRQDGRLLRVGQNCSIRYGKSMSMFEIKELSQDGYREELVDEVQLSTGSKFGDCCHTLQVTDNFVITDGMRIGRR